MRHMFFDKNLTKEKRRLSKGDASKRIDELQQKTGRGGDKSS